MNWKLCLTVGASLLCLSTTGIAQSFGTIRGRVNDERTNQPIPFATVTLQGSAVGTTSDFEGNYELKDVPAGIQNIQFSFVGYEPRTVFEIEVTPARPAVVNAVMKLVSIAIEEAEVVGSRRPNVAEAPLSVRNLGTNEIKRNPGGGRDISRALRTLPGVAAIPSFRNDIVVRGGAPNENRFYIDGIEIPNINHFATQGASGGPVGMINVDLVENIDFYAGAFPSARGNALSSVMEFSFKEARTDEWTANMVVGTSDLGLTIEGPTGENSSLILSMRRSYLQFLFEALGLPFLPIYNDCQFKWTARPNDKNAVTVIGLGALDDFELNLGIADDTAAANYLDQVAILGALDVQKQWNYTQGIRWDNYRDNGKWTLVASRNMLNNRAFKHLDNNEDAPLIRDYLSQEIENKFRVERKLFGNTGWEATLGAGYEYVKYNNRTSEQRYNPAAGALDSVAFASDLKAHKYGVFGTVNRKVLDERLTLCAGFRADGSTLAEGLRNPLRQFSPRFSASYAFAPGWTLNANTGRYFQLPAYTILGYVEDGERINVGEDARYFSNTQAVAGIRWEGGKRNIVASLEGFWKGYQNAPVSVRQGVPLANLGADFGVVGNEAVVYNGAGRSYGAEVLLQQRFYQGFYGLLAYTFVRSEYAVEGGDYVPSSWDNRHILSVTGGKKFKGGWEIGSRLLFSGGLPYTPVDFESLAAETWNFYGRPLLDYSLLNTERNGAFHQLDIRIDKKWFFERWSLDVFIEVQNATGAAVPQPTFIDVVRNPLNGQPVPSVTQPGYYDARELDPSTGAVLPALGLIVEL
ncbi:MAG: ferric aerobactin receptor [Crocinitomicaceae bacterium]|nr:ferric aerobactin receptor [Crocinitomicaceae bacterium]